MNTKLNMDVLQHILSYNDDGLRILKIKMNQQNMKYLFENSRDIYHYLWCMKASLKFPNKKIERIYVDILEHLSNKNYKMKEIKNYGSFLVANNGLKFYKQNKHHPNFI